MRYKKIFFLLYFIGCMFLCSSAFSEYIDNGDGTVTDAGMGLMWQQATTPADAWHFSDYCPNLSLGGYSDWRLPTVKELSILFDNRLPSPGLTSNKNLFPDTKPLNYWSSNTGAELWKVLFYSGREHSTKERESTATVVRCVRDSD